MSRFAGKRETEYFSEKQSEGNVCGVVCRVVLVKNCDKKCKSISNLKLQCSN